MPKLKESSHSIEAVPGLNQFPETAIDWPFWTKTVEARFVLVPNNPVADVLVIWVKPLRISEYGTVELHDWLLLLSWARKTMLSKASW